MKCNQERKRSEKEMDKISIIGSGFVGEILGRGLIELGNEVIFYDIVDKELPEFTKDINYAVRNSSISFLCVPTPTTPEGIDLSYIKEATENIGKVLSEKSDYHVVVVKSTVVPKTTEEVVIPILEKYSGKRAGEDFVFVKDNVGLTILAAESKRTDGEVLNIGTGKPTTIIDLAELIIEL